MKNQLGLASILSILIIALFTISGCKDDSDTLNSEDIRISEISIIDQKEFGGITSTSDSSYFVINYSPNGLIESINETRAAFACSISEGCEFRGIDLNTDITFNRNTEGQLISYEQVSAVVGSNSITDNCTITYENGLISTIECISENSSFTNRLFLRRDFEYDQNNRIQSISTFSSFDENNLGFDNREEFSVDGNGNIIEVRRFEEGNILRGIYSFDHTSSNNFAFDQLEMAILFRNSFLFDRNFAFALTPNNLSTASYEDNEFERLQYGETFEYSIDANGIPREIIIERTGLEAGRVILNLNTFELD